MDFHLHLSEQKKKSPNCWVLHPQELLQQVLLQESNRYQLTFEGPICPSLRLLDVEIEMKAIVVQRGEVSEYTVNWEFDLMDYAGETMLSLWNGDQSIWSGTFLIKPAAGKLSQDEYFAMIEGMPDFFAAVLQGMGNVQLHWSEGEVESSLIASLVSIKAYEHEVVRTLRQVILEGRRELRTDVANLPLHATKRLSGSSVRKVSRNPRIQAALRGDQENGVLCIPNLLKTETFEAPSNRYIKQILLQLEKRCTLLAGKICYEMLSEKMDFAKKRLQYFGGVVDQFRDRLAALERSSFFRNLEPAPLSQSGLQAIASHPAYKRFHRVAMAILHPQFTTIEPFGKGLGIPAIPTWHIFEYWVLVRFMTFLKEILPDLKWTFFGKWDDKGIKKMLNRRVFDPLCLIGESRDGELQVQLTYQERFPAYHSTTQLGKKRAQLQEDFRSISGTMIPDIFLRIRRGVVTKAAVFDAKYRTNETAIKQSLDALHVYKNGLRFGGEQVCGAFLLVPACEERVEKYFTEQYRDQFQFGGFRLNPNDEDDGAELKVWLERWLRVGEIEEEKEAADV